MSAEKSPFLFSGIIHFFFACQFAGGLNLFVLISNKRMISILNTIP